MEIKIEKWTVCYLYLNLNLFIIMSDYVPTPGYLYILHNPSYEEDVYKLGYARDLDQRMMGYSTPYVKDSNYLHTSSVLLDSVLAEKMLEEKLAVNQLLIY